MKSYVSFHFDCIHKNKAMLKVTVNHIHQTNGNVSRTVEV